MELWVPQKNARNTMVSWTEHITNNEVFRRSGTARNLIRTMEETV